MEKSFILELSKKFLAIESISDHPSKLKQVIDLAEKYLKDQNIILHRFQIKGKPSLVATLTKTKTPEIMLNGHLDVVPGKPLQFKPKVVGDKLYARGAHDMKAACAVMIQVFKKLAKDNKYPREKLGLMIVTDEEIGGHNGSLAVLNKGYHSKFLMTGESTNLNIEIAAKGILWLRVSSKGNPAHGAYPWNGKNAVLLINNFINKIQKIYPVPKKEVWKTTCNISSISGGNATNKVPESCELKMDIRYIPQDNPNKILEKIKKIAPKSLKLETLMLEPPLFTDPKDNYLRHLAKIISQYKGKKPKFTKQHGASDARFFPM